jgi:protein-S-isoprenylcysteine O-methyltransferase Ste14
VGTACLLYISRKSLRVVHSHGFYRFFAFEAILALILVNFQFWFSNPFSFLHIASWVFLLASLIFVGEGVYLIKFVGKPNRQREDSTLLSFEKTSTLVTTGIYHYVRHPLYASLLFLSFGVFFKEISLCSTSLTLISIFSLFATAKADEAECIRYFGSPYEEYMVHTKMFVPGLF